MIRLWFTCLVLGHRWWPLSCTRVTGDALYECSRCGKWATR